MAHMEYKLGKDQLGRWGALPITAVHVYLPQWDAHYRVEADDGPDGACGYGPTLEMALVDLRGELQNRVRRASEVHEQYETLLASVEDPILVGDKVKVNWPNGWGARVHLQIVVIVEPLPPLFLPVVVEGDDVRDSSWVLFPDGHIELIALRHLERVTASPDVPKVDGGGSSPALA